MPQGRVRIVNKTDPGQWVEVELSLTDAPATRVEWRVDTRPPGIHYNDGSPVPHRAPEAACLSGAFFALRKLDAIFTEGHGYLVTFEQVSGTVESHTAANEIHLDGMQALAHAAAVGVTYLAGSLKTTMLPDLEGWQLLECQTTSSETLSGMG